MSPELWAVITTGIVILIAVATSNRALRREMGEMRRELGGRIDGLGERLDGLGGRVDSLGERVNGLSERIAEVRREMIERLADVRERLGRVEGLLEGIGFARRQRDGQGRGEERGPALPQP